MTTLVFLHGAGDDENAYKWLFNDVAEAFDAEPVRFNAPFVHETKINRYKWFNKFCNGDRRDAVIAEYNYSFNYVVEKLNNLEDDISDVILIGHSQGGGLAVHIGLELSLKGVISINGDLPYNLSYQKKTKTPIYWLESAEDTYLSDERKQSYKLIAHNNNFHHLVLPDSTHTEFADDLLKLLKIKVMEF